MRVADAVDEKDRKDLLVGVIDIKFHKDHPGHMLFQACIPSCAVCKVAIFVAVRKTFYLSF